MSVIIKANANLFYLDALILVNVNVGSYLDAADEENICCAEICGKTTHFHPCPCLAPVRQDPIPYDALLEKRKADHPEWYIDPYGLADDDHANKIMR